MPRLRILSGKLKICKRTKWKLTVKNIITEISPLSTFNSRLDTVEERNNKSEDKSEDDI